jgi:hypothetical protein
LMRYEDQDEEGADDEFVGSHKVIYLSVVEIVDIEWVRTQEWYQEAENVKVEPTHIVRIMQLSNTGWNMPLVINGSSVEDWHAEDLAGNAPAYQGCYEFTGGYGADGHGIGELINDTEAVEWVKDLATDYEDLWV